VPSTFEKSPGHLFLLSRPWVPPTGLQWAGHDGVTLVCVHTREHTRAHARNYTHAHTHTHTHNHTHTHTLSHTRTHAHAHTHAHTHTHTTIKSIQVRKDRGVRAQTDKKHGRKKTQNTKARTHTQTHTERQVENERERALSRSLVQRPTHVSLTTPSEVTHAKQSRCLAPL